MTIEADNTQEMPTGVAHAHQAAAAAAVSQAVTNHKKTGEDIDGPSSSRRYCQQLTAEDLHQLALHTFITRRYKRPTRGGSRRAGGALRDLVAFEFDRDRLGDEALATKYMKLNIDAIDAITAIIKTLLDEQLP